MESAPSPNSADGVNPPANPPDSGAQTREDRPEVNKGNDLGEWMTVQPRSRRLPRSSPNQGSIGGAAVTPLASNRFHSLFTENLREDQSFRNPSPSLPTTFQTQSRSSPYTKTPKGKAPSQKAQGPIKTSGGTTSRKPNRPPLTDLSNFPILPSGPGQTSKAQNSPQRPTCDFKAPSPATTPPEKPSIKQKNPNPHSSVSLDESQHKQVINPQNPPAGIQPKLHNSPPTKPITILTPSKPPDPPRVGAEHSGEAVLPHEQQSAPLPAGLDPGGHLEGNADSPMEIVPQVEDMCVDVVAPFGAVERADRGAGKKQFRNRVKDLVREYKPTILVVVEPRISGTKADRIIRRLGFSNSHRVEARGYAGGLWMLWNASIVDVSIIHSHTQFIHSKVVYQGSPFVFTAIYGSPQEKWRRFLWQNIEALAVNISEPWILSGDFNAILSGEERKDRLGRNGVANNQFLQCVNTTHLIDLGSNGPKFTWRRGREHARLDRVLCNLRWLSVFPTMSVINLPLLSSDHRPILLRQTPQPGGPPPERPFRFQTAWTHHPDFKRFVTDQWVPHDKALEAAGNFIENVQQWNVQVFGNIHKRKRRLLARINGIQRYLENKPSCFLSNLELELRLELESILMQEELLWQQKAKTQWIQAGDRNTPYFHASSTIKQKMILTPSRETISGTGSHNSKT
ncbi:hypothetical protein Tsubulata_007388 [Turnera subulata]|uniref:Endonuclease/exonuclease/phosphatase domain-containing protein n=1 Tax=Turnera subulata TaxID=218843 RepID=A0A9Q0J5C0_9ROSI|nr:hypothetical protein Tsubulata_007388 [Turnera subulata]